MRRQKRHTGDQFAVTQTTPNLITTWAYFSASVSCITEEQYRESIRCDPDFPQSHNNLAGLFMIVVSIDNLCLTDSVSGEYASLGVGILRKPGRLRHSREHSSRPL